MPIWIMVANAQRAQIFACENIASLEDQHQLIDLHDWVNPHANMREGEINADGSGNMQHGAGHGSMDAEHTTRDNIEQEFAKECAKALNMAKQSHDFGKLYLFAAPKFLGLIRPHFSGEVRADIDKELNLDIANMPKHEIFLHIQKNLQI